MHILGTFGVRTSHKQPRTHKTHHGLKFGEATTFPFIVFSATLHMGPHPNDILSWDSQVGISKFPQPRLPQLWGRITSRVDFRLWWSLKQSCSPHRELSNGMFHTAYMRGPCINSWLLMVRSQIVNSTPNLSFDHILYFRCLHESCEPILDIYVSITF
jgi:hypothetical protein